jgi:ComF family protein
MEKRTMLWIHDFLSLIYPRNCVCCGNGLWGQEQVICTFCDFHLPRTWFHLEHDNPVSRTFWGRIRLEGAASYLHFNKGNNVQQLIHHLKYKGRKDIGIYLGARYGLSLKNSPFFHTAELVIPVPLHRKKMRQRGYNQSEQFAIGLADAMNIPVGKQLIRTSPSGTQTRKSRFTRWENVSGIFRVPDPIKLSGKHILLVDDVITTGATLEACAGALSLIPDTRISIATIAAVKI